MRPIPPLFALLTLAFLAVPATGHAQEPTDTMAAAEAAAPVVPSRLAEVERARSASCVSIFAELDRLDEALDPLAQRAQRLQALARAMALEDSTEVAPFDASDPMEAQVQAWFVSDAALGQRYAETGDTALLSQRAREKEAVRTELRTVLERVGGQGQEMVAAAGDVQGANALCQGKFLVRGAVLSVCDTTESPVCAAARSDSIGGRFRFVDEPEDLWDVESLRAWRDPQSLSRGPDGGLVGGRTSGSVRRGNVGLSVGVGSILRARDELEPGEVEQLDANLDSMGFIFQHPDIAMIPALEITVDIPASLAGETHYFLHFGDLSDPANQVVWTTEADLGSAVQASVPAPPAVLLLLQSGEPLSLTAVRLDETEAVDDEGVATTGAEALYTIGLTPVAQAQAVGALLSYMGGGGFSQDLNRLVPPTGGR